MLIANPKPPSTELRPLVFVVVVPERELLLVIPAAPADSVAADPPNNLLNVTLGGSEEFVFLRGERIRLF